MSLDDNIRAFQRTPLLSEIGVDALRLLAFATETINLVDGEILFEQGEIAPGGYTVVHGKIRLDAGNGNVTVAGPGAVIGEMALLVDTTRPCDAYAFGPARVLSMPRKQFLRIIEEFPDMAAGLRAKLTARMRAQLSALNRVQARLDKLPTQE